MKRSPDPALVCYSLGRGWQDLQKVFRKSFADLGPALDRQFDGFAWDKQWWSSAYRLGAWVGLALIGSALIVSLSALHALVLAVVALVSLSA